MIRVVSSGPDEWLVTVESGTTTTHRVHLSKAQLQEIAGTDAVAPELLIERSFEFLLAREPNTSILQRFELPVIGRYFPEYVRDIRRLISRP